MRDHSKENIRLGKVVFLICIVLSMLAVMFCSGQNYNTTELPRIKSNNMWVAYSKIAFDSNGDTVHFGSVFYPGPYDFKTIFVHTTGKNRFVSHLVLAVYFENGAVTYLSSYNKKNERGDSWFHLSDEEKNKFKQRKITKIELFNQENNDSFVVDDWEYQYYIAAINQ
jgi:hypothetical protein